MQFEPAFSSNSSVDEIHTTMMKTNTHTNHTAIHRAHISVHSSQIIAFLEYCKATRERERETIIRFHIWILSHVSTKKLFGVVRLKSNHSVISLVYLFFYSRSVSHSANVWNVLSMEMECNQSKMQAQNASFIFFSAIALVEYYRSRYEHCSEWS